MGRKVCIIDYGSGNIRSVYNIFREIHDDVKVSNDPAEVEAATHIVLPGVGAFGAAMNKLKALPSFEVFRENVLVKKKPYLGICVGMQILADQGFEYGIHRGLGWIPGMVKKLDVQDLRLPHVGWNNLESCKEDPLMEEVDAAVDFYYVHSYHFEVANPDDCLATCEYGREFTSIVHKDNVYGVQFHPEKSQRAGKRLLENFLRLSS